MMWISLFLVALWVASSSAYSFPDCTKAPLKNDTVCDPSKDVLTRAKALINLFTVPELINNTGNTSPGVSRLGLPSYQWWSEGLHGVASSPGVSFAPSGDFSYATSFPQPILMSAAFDDDLIKQVATVISTEARAFNNVGRAGLDFFTPNINPFRDPRWGRGQETPGEDPFHIAQYVYNLIEGLQGGIDPEPYLKVVADCKHFAGYDVDNWEGVMRYGFNAVISQQDLAEYFLPPFQSCVRDAKVASVMCSYNAVNGIPSCADSYLLQSILREFWDFGGWVVSDCDAVGNIFTDHHFTSTLAEAAADALKAGTDINCGGSFQTALPDALNQSLITEGDLQNALVRQYSSLIRLGYFDPVASQPYRKLSWSDVGTSSAQNLAYQAATEGIVLLKNDGVLPLNGTIKKLAFIGPWANASTQMQGNYAGVAKTLITPLQGAIAAGYDVTYAAGTTISSSDTSQFAAAVSAAQSADAIVFAGGIDDSIEAEAMDREAISWPGNQLDLVAELEKVGKPLIVLQFGGGQVDDTALKNSQSVNAIVWGGYPGQSGGAAIADILKGKVAPAGRLPLTQYPADYVSQVPMTDMALRPSSSSPGRTYKFYTGTPVFEFGHGLHYTSFSLAWAPSPRATYDIESLVSQAASSGHPDLATFDTFSVNVKNTGHVTSDYIALLFVSGSFGPQPYPNKSLVSYARIKSVAAGKQETATLKVTLGAIARADDNGNLWVYPGSYQIAVDTPGLLTTKFELRGQATQVTHFPQPAS